MRKILLLAATAVLMFPVAASAQAIIDNGTVQLGVNTSGALNFSGVGLKSLTSGNEATFPGCTCEGWGAAVSGTGTTVFANTAIGSSFTGVSFASTASTATSVVTDTGATPSLEVTHAFSASSTAFLYQVDVTIKNVSGADFTGNTLYRRTMDWDIEPTPFNEFVTIGGTGLATNVLGANDNGFCNSDPLSPCAPLNVSGDFVDNGPNDHGANFDFTFSPLLAGESRLLRIFFGVAPTRTAAFAALASVGGEVYSFGNANNGGVAGDETFIFAFQGVGGTVVGVPEPGTWALMILGFGTAGAMLRRRRSLAVA